jgi:hypothetical protein
VDDGAATLDQAIEGVGIGKAACNQFSALGT